MGSTKQIKLLYDSFEYDERFSKNPITFSSKTEKSISETLKYRHKLHNNKYWFWFS